MEQESDWYAIHHNEEIEIDGWTYSPDELERHKKMESLETKT